MKVNHFCHLQPAVSAECCEFIWMSSLAKCNPVKINDVSAVLYCCLTIPPLCFFSPGLQMSVSYVVGYLGICITVRSKALTDVFSFFYCSRWMDTGVQSHLSLMPMSGWRCRLKQRAAGVRAEPWHWDMCGLIRFCGVFLALVHTQRGVGVCVCFRLFACVCVFSFVCVCVFSCTHTFVRTILSIEPTE